MKLIRSSPAVKDNPAAHGGETSSFGRVIFCDTYPTAGSLKAEQDVLFSPSVSAIANCRGCLACWFETPAHCSLPDGAADLSKLLSASRELIILSECCYGCCSPFVKNLMDRSVSYVHPYFRQKKQTTLHFLRSRHRFSIRFLFYGEAVSPEEQETAISFAHAFAQLMNASDCRIRFFRTADLAWNALA